MNRFRNTRQPDWDWWGRLWPAPGETLRTVGVSPGETLAEVGSGNGYFALPAARITAPGTVYAVDIDTSLLDDLSHLADKQAIDNLSTVAGDARTLSERLPKDVDVVLVANTFHGVDETTPFVREAFESLRPGGRVIIVNWKNIPREDTRIAGEPRGPPTELRMSPERTERSVLDAAPATPGDIRVDRSPDKYSPSTVEANSINSSVDPYTIELPPYHYALVFES